MNPPENILIYGLGSIARKHIAAIRQLWGSDASVYALRSGKGHVTEEEGIVNLFSDESVHFKPAFIIISDPTALRQQTLSRALQFGVPLFIEKPVLDDPAHAGALQEEIDRKSIPTYVACNLRFHPCLLYIQEHMEAIGHIDEVNIYCGSYLPDWRPGTDFRNSYSARAEMGGGVHLDLIHEIDYCCWLFGLPVAHTSFKSNHSHLQISAVDYAHYLLVYKAFAASVTLNYFRKDRKRNLEIVAESGTWTADLVANRVVHNGNVVADFPDFQITDTYRKQLNYFWRQISEGVPPMNSFREALEPLNIILS